MAHKTLFHAGEVLDVLRSEIGNSAADKKTEDAFLRGAQTQLRGVLRSAREYLDYWNYLDDVNIRQFRKGVSDLLEYVTVTLATPYDQRGEPDFK